MGNRTNFFNAGLINVLLEALYSNIYTVVTMYNWYQWIHTCTIAHHVIVIHMFERTRTLSKHPIFIYVHVLT